MLHVYCQCGKSLKVPESAIGHTGKCPACKTGVRLVAPHYQPGSGGFTDRLVIAQGPARDGEQFLLGGPGPIEIGKLHEKPIFLPGKKVSRSHCWLIRAGAGWRIEDQGSTNGISINGKKTPRHDLLDGDVLQIGEYLLQYQSSTSEGVTSPPSKQLVRQPEKQADQEEPGEDHRPITLHDPVPSRLEIEKQSKHVIEEADSFLASDMYEVKEPDPDDTAVPEPEEEKDKGPAPTCRGCGKTFPKSARICVDCGIDLRTGKTLLTSSEDNLDEVYSSYEPILWLLSWPVFVGFFPISSEALGVRRPYFTWAIVAITCLMSIGVWIGEGKDLARGTKSRLQMSKHLMLWCGQAKPTAMEVDYADWRYGDREKFDAKVDDLKARLEASGKKDIPEDRIYHKILSDLPPSDRYYGEFEISALLTSAFLHEGFLHLIGNMLFLLVIGGRVNALVGNFAMVFIYPILAMASALIFRWSVSGESPHAYLGASGAIMGLAGMYLVLMPIARVHTVLWIRPWLIGLAGVCFMSFALFRLYHKIVVGRGFWVLLIWIAFDIFDLLVGSRDSVAHWAHVGGFLSGMVLGLLLLLTRSINARSGDLLTALLGPKAWKLIGKPDPTRRSPIAIF